MIKLATTALLATAIPALASVTATFSGGALLDSSSTALSAGSVIIVVADTNAGNGTFPSSADFLGATLNEGATVGGDLILSSFTLNDAFGANTGTYSHQETFTLAAGTSLALFWFEGVTDANATVTAGTKYGSYTTTTVDAASGGNHAYTVPTDGSTGVQIAYFDENFAGPSSVAKSSDYVANMTVTAVPEPSSTALLGLGSVALLLRRRR